MIVLSILGTVGAAGAAGRLGQLIDANPQSRNLTGVVALWIVGIGSPMLFNSFIAWAHTLIAALLCWGFYLLLPTSFFRPKTMQPTTPMHSPAGGLSLIHI